MWLLLSLFHSKILMKQINQYKYRVLSLQINKKYEDNNHNYNNYNLLSVYHVGHCAKCFFINPL